MANTYMVLVETHPFDNKRLYQKSAVLLHPGVTILVGANGSGKTTFLDFLKRKLKEEERAFFSFDNLHEGGSNALERAMFRDDLPFVAESFCSSEGENIQMNLMQTAGSMGRLIRQHPEQTEYFFLFDAIDSGLSINYLTEFKHFLHDVVIGSNPDKEIYIVIAANTYELARQEHCLDVYSGTYRKFKDYEEYRKFVLSSAKRMEKYKTNK